jgi:hypothetical protein
VHNGDIGEWADFHLEKEFQGRKKNGRGGGFFFFFCFFFLGGVGGGAKGFVLTRSHVRSVVE